MTVRAWPTTTVTIMRGAAEDAYGDEQDSAVVVQRGVPVALNETSRVTFDRATGQNRTVRTITLRIGSEIDLRDDDRVRDEQTQRLYAVMDHSEMIGVGLEADQRFTLTRVS